MRADSIWVVTADAGAGADIDTLIIGMERSWARIGTTGQRLFAGATARFVLARTILSAKRSAAMATICLPRDHAVDIEGLARLSREMIHRDLPCTMRRNLRAAQVECRTR
jgi:hypothetical protein